MYRNRNFNSYTCPVCTEAVGRGDRAHQRVGPWRVHGRCRVDCALCGEEITEPAVGSQHTISAWCGKPAHAACKRKEQA